jgi:hypothetical protein
MGADSWTGRSIVFGFVGSGFLDFGSGLEGLDGSDCSSFQSDSDSSSTHSSGNFPPRPRDLSCFCNSCCNYFRQKEF